jgi:uncharacterized SAM-binding protein YcdF (DUF218 family)
VENARGPRPAIQAPDAIIVIFGAAVRPDGQPSTTLLHRVEAAAGFGARFTAPLFIPTGAVGRYGASEASVMARLLEARNVPPTRIKLEETGTDTLSSVRAVRQMLTELPPGAPVYAATSGFHLPRCVLLMRLAGVPARAAPPPPYPAAPQLLLRGYWWLREAAALPYDAILMLWLRLTGRT